MVFEDFRLKVFVTVVDEGSFTKAARVLDISQPAVSQNISELEKMLGFSLLERGRAKIEPTPDGAVFLTYARRILYWYKAADELFGERGRLVRNRPVKIAATPFCADFVLPGLLAPYLSGSGGGFILSTYPEGDFPRAEDEADVCLWTARPGGELGFDGTQIVGSIDGVAVTASGVLPEVEHYVAWAPYKDLLGADVMARTVLVSDSIPLLRDLLQKRSDLIGFLPREAASGMTIHPRTGGPLGMDLCLKCSDLFTKSALAASIQRRLAEELTSD